MMNTLGRLSPKYLAEQARSPLRIVSGRGQFVVSESWCTSAPIRWIGPATPAMKRAHSAKSDGFRCAQPILRYDIDSIFVVSAALS
jgi:hypothetical protein